VLAWKKSLPDTHPDIADSLYNMGVSYSNLGEHQKALPRRTSTSSTFTTKTGVPQGRNTKFKSFLKL